MSADRIIVMERAPTRQIQAFTADGRFDAKFGADALQHSRAVAVGRLGQIVVVEGVVGRVLIFQSSGSTMTEFKCASLIFFNGAAVDDKDRFFLSDNRSHCV